MNEIQNGSFRFGFEALANTFYDPDANGVLATREAIKEKVADCYVLSFRAFDSQIREVVFDTADNGGSFEDAMAAFEDALGSVSDDDVRSMMQGYGLIQIPCLESVGIYL